MSTIIDLSVEDLRATRAALLSRVSMSWEHMSELAEAYALDASERNIFDTVCAIDYLLDGDRDE